MKIMLALSYNENNKQTVQALIDRFESLGKKVQIDLCTTLTQVSRQLDSSYKALIIQHHIENNAKVDYTFLDRLTDKCDTTIIPIFDKEEADKEFLESIYAIGIYTLIFSTDTKLDTLVQMCLSGRSKVEAKKYYNIVGAVTADKTGITEQEIISITKAIEKAKNPIEEFGRLTEVLSVLEKQSILDRLQDSVKQAIVDSINSANTSSDVSSRKIVESHPTQVIVQRVQEQIKISALPEDYKKSVAVLSLEPRMGSTTIACEMVQLLSNQGIATSLIDLDLVKFEDYYRFPLRSQGDNLLYYLETNSKGENFGEKANPSLTVFTDYFMKNNSEVENITTSYQKLYRMAKDSSKVVVFDIPYNHNYKETIESVLSWVDHVLVVFNQNAAVISRLHVYKHILKDKTIDFVLNQYMPRVKNFQEKQLGNKLNQLGINFNRSFTIRYSEKMHESLSVRETVMKNAKDNMFIEDIARLCRSYYDVEKKKGLFRRKL